MNHTLQKISAGRFMAVWEQIKDPAFTGTDIEAINNQLEIVWSCWNKTTQTWSPAVALTNNSFADRAPQLAGPMANGDLILTALSVGPGGNVLVIWQEMSQYGTDAHYRVFDPASNTWGLDTLLSNDSDLERSFAPVWDSMGNLVLAYNNVAISLTIKTVALDGGGSITADPDKDGFTNLQEYLAGTNPLDPASHLKVGQFNVIKKADGTSMDCTVSWASVAGRFYRVERSFDLTNWQPVADDIQATQPLNTITDEVALPQARVFYRIVIH